LEVCQQSIVVFRDRESYQFHVILYFALKAGFFFSQEIIRRFSLIVGSASSVSLVAPTISVTVAFWHCLLDGKRIAIFNRFVG
jgi:hypothetical protein